MSPALCRHEAVCGGCGLQQLAYPAQVENKRETLERLLRNAMGARAPRVAAPIGMQAGADGMPWGFRQKAGFVFANDAQGELLMGHFARGTNDVVPVVECPVHAGRANRIAFALRDE